MHRSLVAAVIAALMLVGAGGAVAAPRTSADAVASSKVFDKTTAIVTFKALPISTYDGRIKGYDKTRPSKGKLNPNSAASKKYLGYLKQQHSDFQKWLQRNVPSAKITSEYFVTLNAVAVKLNGVAKGKLANSDLVKSVEFVTLYQKTMSESYKHIAASGAWADAGGRSDAGEGVKVGVIDSGIDASHPFFDPAGFSYPAGFPKCAGSNCDYVTPKVIVAKVFYNKARVRGLDAEAIDSHGTHVAGTVAGVTGKTAEVLDVSIDDMSGVAPGAWLGNYNVFPGTIASARSEDILNAVEAAVLDGMDVLNLSLSGGYSGNNDLLAMGLDNAVDAGVVVAVSAGNNGPGSFTLGSPSRARNVITVAASTNDHFVGQPITYPAGGGTTIGAAVGDFPPLPAGDYDLFDTEGNGCASVPAGAAGNLAVIDRGVCTFSAKVRSAIAAGAVGVIVVNNVAGDPTAMASDGLGGDDLPAVMVGMTDGAGLREAATASVSEDFDEFITDNENIIAGFSSRGPTFVDFAAKPDVTSVGVNVLSSIPVNDDDDWAFFNGTSMSSPHIAGSAAVLLDLHPNWTPGQVKSAIVNTADRVITDHVSGNDDVGPLVQGTGLQNLTDSADAEITFSPTSASFGKVSGSQNIPTNLLITLTNLTGASQTLDVTERRFNPTSAAAGEIVTGDSRINTPSSITIPANGSATLTITVRAGLPSGLIQGWLDLSGPAGDYSLAYVAVVP